MSANIATAVPPNPDRESAPPTSRAREARRDLLNRVVECVMKYDLEVTGNNLAVICNALSGSDPELAKSFAQREFAHEAIDQRWLETVSRFEPDAVKRMNELEMLSDQLEDSLARFAETAKLAQDETSDHRGAISAQMQAMSDESDNAHDGSAVGRVIDISRKMLERVEQIEQAMERSRSETEALRDNLAQARQEANVDHLTELPNRRAFERRFSAASRQAIQEGLPLSVAFCDVDHFKSINDRHGHDAGDRVLRAIASTLTENASDDCFVSRHGGEEFVLLFYGLNKHEAFEKLDRLRRVQAAKQFKNRATGKSFGKVTFSGGVAEVDDGSDIRSVLSRADDALYQAKCEGRNRIVVH